MIGVIMTKYHKISMIFIVFASGIIFFCFWAFAGTITTSVTCRKTVKSTGELDIHLDIRNNGDVMAYNVIVTLVLADIVKKYDNLGNNPPGGKINVIEDIIDPGLKPGNYIAVIRVDFEEENGIPHRVYHMAPIAYLTGKATPSDPPLILKPTSPEFNRKAFWDRKGDIELLAKKIGKEKVLVNTSLFLPDGVSSPAPNAILRLGSESEKIHKFPIHLTGKNGTIFPYHVVAWYENEHYHHSHLLYGKIRILEKPVYFKWFVKGSGVVLGIIFLLIVISIFVRRYREKSHMRSD